MMKLNTEYVLCKENFYLIGSDHPVYAKGEFYELIKDEGLIIVLGYEYNNNFNMVNWDRYFETDSQGLLRKFQVTEMLF